MTKLFFFIIFIIMHSEILGEGDLTRQKPIPIKIFFKSIEGSTHYFEPNSIELETGKLYKLILVNESSSKHYFISQKLSESVFTRKTQVISNGKKISEIKGHIKEIEIFPNSVVEWWLVPVKTGSFEDLYCNVKDKKVQKFHSDMGMTGTINIY